MGHKCPICAKEFSRRFNKEVHIKRIHKGMSLPLNNHYEAPNAMSFGYPNRNPNPEPNYSGKGVWGQTNKDNQQEDFMDGIIDSLHKQVEIKELMSRLMPSSSYPGSYAQQFYYPWNQSLPNSSNFSSWPLQQSYQTVPVSSITISDPISNKHNKNLIEDEIRIRPKSFQLISLRGLICDKCLTIDTIPSYLYKDGTLKEINNHSCEENRILDLQRRDKHDLNRYFVYLHRILPKLLTIKVMICNGLQSEIYLWIMKCNGVSASYTDIYDLDSWSCPIRLLDAFPSEHQWINQITNNRKQENIIKLESKEELLSFLEISMDSTVVMLRVKPDSSISTLPETWDSYLVGLNLSEHNLEKVITPFVPEASN